MPPDGWFTPTVWLHGAALNSATWAPPAAGLCLDLPGHGRTPPTNDVSVRGFAAALQPKLPRHFTLVGHSLGAMIAMDLAARHPNRCGALVLVDPPLRFPLSWLPGQGAFLGSLVARLPGPRGVGALMALRVENQNNRPLVRQAIASVTRKGLRDAMVAALRFDGIELLPRLTMPTLVLLGKRSVLTGRNTEQQLRDLLPKGTIETWDTGHMIPFDAPQAFYQRVTTFLADNTRIKQPG